MSLLVAALTIGFSAGLGLAYIRWASSGGEASRTLLVGAMVASFGASVAVLCLAWAVLESTATDARRFDSTYAGMAAGGAVVGLTVFVTVRLVIFEVASTLWHWSCRLPREIERTWGEYLATNLLTLAGVSITCALVFAIGHAVAPHGLAIWLVPFFVVLLPLYETYVVPSVQYARAPALASEELTELEAWIERIRSERALPPIRVRIQNGTFPNAFAVGGLGAPLIVIGKGLVDRFPAAHLQAVVAHEIAHVARRDVPRLLPVVTVAGTLHAITVATISYPLFATDQVWGLASGTVSAGLLAAVFMLAIPGFFMRRMEFGADRLAAEILGDGEPLAQALEQLCELSGQPLTQRSWSHPTMQARVTALRSLST